MEKVLNAIAEHVLKTPNLVEADEGAHDRLVANLTPMRRLFGDKYIIRKCYHTLFDSIAFLYDLWLSGAYYPDVRFSAPFTRFSIHLLIYFLIDWTVAV